MMVAIEAARWLTEHQLGITGSALAGVLTGVLAVAFTLGGVWALRGRPALAVPTCRRCRSPVRGAGLHVPSSCPECGVLLAHRRAVRWLRFRRQPATLLITAPVVLVGGLAIAYICAVAATRAIIDQFEAWNRPQPEPAAWQNQSDVAVVGGAANSATTPDVSSPEPHIATVTELVEQARRGDASAWHTLSLRVRTSAGDQRAEDDWGYVRLLRMTARWDARFVVVPRKQLAEDERALLRRLVNDAIDHPRVSCFRSLGAEGAMVVFDLASALVERNFASVEWGMRAVEGLRGAPRCVLPPQVNPGADVGLTIVTAVPEGYLYGGIQRVRLNGEVVVDAPEYVQGRLSGSTRVGFTAPAQEGDYDVEVDWHVAQGGLEYWFGMDLSERGNSHVQLRVARGPERLPKATDPSLSPFTRLDASLEVAVTNLGARYLVWIMPRPISSVALIGTWSIELDGEWREIFKSATTSPFRPNVRLLAPPESGWGDTVRLRFDPAPDDALVLPSPPPGTRLSFYSRVNEMAWGEPREFVARLRARDGPSNRDRTYVWESALEGQNGE